MKPDIKLLLNEAKRPQVHYVPARAGWNGPEEKSGSAIANPLYDQLRHEATPTEVRQQLLAAALPDWRLFLFIAGLILSMRFLKANNRKAEPQASILTFPSSSTAFAHSSANPAASEAA